MKKQLIALSLVAGGLCLVAIATQLSMTQDKPISPPVNQKPITVVDVQNPYEDALDHQYETTDESLGSIDETYGNEQQIRTLPPVKITVEIGDPNYDHSQSGAAKKETQDER